MEASSQDWAKEVSLDGHAPGGFGFQEEYKSQFKNNALGIKYTLLKNNSSDNYLLSNHFFAIVAAKTPAAPIPITPPTHPV